MFIWTRLIGSVLVGFGVPGAFIVQFVAHRSVLFLLMVTAAFVALAPLLLSSLLWLAIKDLQDVHVFHVVFGVIFQELVRWFALQGYTKAEAKLIAMAPDQHNLSLNDISSSLAIGTGFGVMQAVVQFGGILAQSWQTAALFTPGCEALTVYELAAAQSLLLSLLQMVCTVQILERARKRSWLSLAGVYALRLAFSAASLANTAPDSTDSCVASIPVQAIIVLVLVGWTAYLVLTPTYSGLVAARSWARGEAARRQQAAAQQEWSDARQAHSNTRSGTQAEQRGAELVQRR